MAYTRSSSIMRALTRAIRGSAVYPALTGGIHRGFAPEKAPYPLCVMRFVASPYLDDWTGRMLVAVVDVVVISRQSVQADNLDQSLLEALDNAELVVGGQTHMITRRIADLELDPEDDGEEKVYTFGGTYEIWTHQHQSAVAPRSGYITADAVIVTS